MSRTGIRYQDVLNAVAVLENQGIVPNIETVRGVLGTGSNSTISNYLKLWRNGVNPSTVIRLTREPTPEIVKDAVDRVWQDISAKASSEVEAIKNDTQALIEAADEKVATAEKRFHNLQLLHDELQGQFRAQRSENERLILELKKTSEEYALLNERFTIMQQCYSDLKAQTTHHLEYVSNVHKEKIAQLVDNIKIQSEDHAKSINALKEQHDKERNQLVGEISQLKSDHYALNDVVLKLQSELQEKMAGKSKLEADINLALTEKSQATSLLMEHEKKWSSFNDKTLISTDILSKIINAPMLDEWINKIHTLLDSSLSNKLSEMKNFFKQLESKKKLES